MNFLSEESLSYFLYSIDNKNMKDYLGKLLLEEIKKGNKFSKKSLFLSNIIFINDNTVYLRGYWYTYINKCLFNKNKELRKGTQLFLDKIKIFKKDSGD